jgi:Uma2 family endonuclease
MLEVVDKPATCQQASPLSRETYHAMIESGIVGPKNELLWGVIVEKMSKSPLHTRIVASLLAMFANRLNSSIWVRKEEPLVCQDSEPEPDIAFVRGEIDDFREAHPETAELVIEVAVSSLAIDREKASLYATANVPQYWILNLNDKTLEVYSKPLNGAYQECRTISEGDTLEVPCTEGLTLNLGELFA